MKIKRVKEGLQSKNLVFKKTIFGLPQLLNVTDSQSFRRIVILKESRRWRNYSSKIGSYPIRKKNEE